MASRFIIPTADVGSGISPSRGAQLFFSPTGVAFDVQTQDTYPTDADADAKTNANANPVIANGKGVFPDIWIEGSYKVVLKDKNDVQTGFGEADPVISTTSSAEISADLAERPITKATIAEAKADDELVNSVGGFVTIERNDNGLDINSDYEILAGHGTDDGGSILNSDTGTLFHLKLIVENNTVTSAIFNMTQDGTTTDDSTQWKAMVDFCGTNNVIGDGENRATLLTGVKSFSPTTKLYLKNMNITAGTDYTDQPFYTFLTDVEYQFENFAVDGERDTRAELEPWTVFTTFAGVDSIQPTTGRFFDLSPFLTNDVTISNFNFTNCHYDVCLNINSHATVFIENFKADFCSNKTYHVFHGTDGGSQPDSGVTIANGIRTNDCGIMPANFLVDDVAKVRADNFAPQASFGAIVTFGRYTISNVFVNNYGSTGVTADRNKSFTSTNTQFVHTDPNAFSNNSSGAMWLEACDKAMLVNTEIKITARDSRETAIDNTALQIFVSSGQICELSNTILESVAGANLSKDMRISMTAGSTLIVNGYSIEGNGSTVSIGAANVSGLSNKLQFNNGRVRGSNIVINDTLDLVFDDLDSDVDITVGQSLGTPGGAILFDNVNCGDVAISGMNGDIKISGGKMTVVNTSTSGGSRFGKMHWGGGLEIIGVSTLTAGTDITFGDVETGGRTVFIDIFTVNITGGKYKTAAGENILDFIPPPATMQQASVIGASLWIKTGTGGAGYINFNGNVIANADLGNSKVNVAWT
jgi:hypothetical protein